MMPDGQGARHGVVARTPRSQRPCRDLAPQPPTCSHIESRKTTRQPSTGVKVRHGVGGSPRGAPSTESVLEHSPWRTRGSRHGFCHGPDGFEGGMELRSKVVIRCRIRTGRPQGEEPVCPASHHSLHQIAHLSCWQYPATSMYGLSGSQAMSPAADDPGDLGGRESPPPSLRRGADRPDGKTKEGCHDC